MVTRYRCRSCGNLTRFDVVSTRRTKAFHHFSIGGDLAIEDEELLSESIEAVTCRWCGGARAIETIDEEVAESRPSQPPPASQPHPASQPGPASQPRPASQPA